MAKISIFKKKSAPNLEILKNENFILLLISYQFRIFKKYPKGGVREKIFKKIFRWEIANKT